MSQAPEPKLSSTESESSAPVFASWGPLVLVFITIAVLPLFLIYDRPGSASLDTIREAGVLRVLTVNSPTTFYEGPDGSLGLEYELARGFAEQLRVELELETADSVASIFPRLARGDAYFAAAGLIVNKEREQLVRFTPTYQKLKQQAVYLKGSKKPESIADLVGREIKVVAGSSVAHHLSALKASYPELTWTETSERSAEELLYDVWQDELDMTIADSNLIAVARQHYPELRVGFSIDDAVELAWAFPRNEDDSIYQLAADYLEEQRQNGELDRLLERYYGTAESYKYINISEYRRKIESVLPRYDSIFKAAERATGIDWRLLAAMGYQESHWDPNAVSPTGVKGIMQLTEATAKQMEIDDRTDPTQSIMAGARYLKLMKRKIPDRIQEPDRTWLAMASYNLGFGHLEDARILTQKAGRNPDLWLDVKEYLPKLADPEWYEQTRYGKARGGEAFAFVTRIRTFYDVLARISPALSADEIAAESASKD